jgi:hypothetical protein
LLGVKEKKCHILWFSVDVDFADLYIRDIEMYGTQHKEMLELYKTHDLEKTVVNGKEIHKVLISLKGLLTNSEYTHLMTYLEADLNLVLSNKKAVLI